MRKLDPRGRRSGETSDFGRPELADTTPKRLLRAQVRRRLTPRSSTRVVELAPTPPFHFDSTLHKPDHFPSADNEWQPGVRWQRCQN